MDVPFITSSIIERARRIITEYEAERDHRQAAANALSFITSYLNQRDVAARSTDIPEPVQPDAQFWCMCARVLLQMQDTSRPWWCMNMARNSSGYTPLLQGDFQRDVARMNIRARHFKDAENALQNAEALSTGDRARTGAQTTVKGHLAFGRKQYKKAAQLYRAAHVYWKRLAGKEAEQGALDTAFHLIKAAIAHKGRRHADEIDLRPFIALVLKSDDTRRKAWVKAFLRYSAPAVWLYRQSEHVAATLVRFQRY